MGFTIKGKLIPLLYQNPLDLTKGGGWDTLKTKINGLSPADPLRATQEKYGPAIGKHIQKQANGWYKPMYPAPQREDVQEPPLTYDPNFAKAQLNVAPKGWEKNPQYSRLINFIDAETTSLGGSNILSWSRLGVTYNYKTRQLEYVSSEDRFYYPTKKGRFTAGAWGSNNLYAEDITSLRSGAKYSETWDPSEQKYLESQLRGSIIAGHNILNADIPWLLTRTDASTLDTLIAAENLKGRGHNQLNELFSFFHKGLKPQKIGIQEHLSQHDVLMNAFVLEKMLQKWPELLKDFSYINKHIGASYAPKTRLNGVKSNITIGNKYVLPAGVTGINPYIMTEADYYANRNAGFDYDPKKDFYAYDDEGNRTEAEGFHLESGDERIDLIGLNENATDAAVQRWLDEEEGKILPSGGIGMGAKEWAEFSTLIEELKRAVGGLATGYTDLAMLKAAEARRDKMSIASRISSFSPEDQDKFLRNLGISGNEQDPYIRAAEIIRSNKLREQEEAERERQERKIEAQQERKKEVDLYGLYKDGKLTGGQYDYLVSGLNATNVSFKDFKRQLDEATRSTEAYAKEQEEARQRSQNAISNFARTPFYDFQQWINVGQKQWEGIQKAASGFVPSRLMKPISHYGNAVLNAYQSELSGIKKYTAPTSSFLQSVGTSLLIGGVGTGNPALLAAGGITKGMAALTTQVVGKYKQHQMTQFGEDLQMRLNLVSAGVQTLLLPFRLLTSTALRLTKIFGGLGAAIAGITISGLKDMTQMGNPLSEMTGAGYDAYYNSIAGDYGALLAAGTTNSFMEDLAASSSNLFTLGQMDTRKMLAATMLGQFHRLYSMDANAEGNMTSMINDIFAQLKDADPIRKRDIMTYASAINPALPKILQSMTTLGVDNYEQLMDPSRRGVRWTAGRGKEFMEGWRKQFQWDQYEFQAIGKNIGFNKDRIVDRIWKSFGFNLYNGLNIVLEKIADGDWKGAMNTIGEGIKSLGEGISQHRGVFADLWKQLKELFKAITGGGIGDKLKELGASLKDLGIQMAEGFLRGITPLIELMDRIKFDPWAFIRGENPFSIGEQKQISREDKIHKVVSDQAAGTLYNRLKERGAEPSGNIYDLTMEDLYNYLSREGTPEDLRQLGVEPIDLKDFDSFAKVFTRGDLSKMWYKLTRPGENGEYSEVGKMLDTQITTGVEAVKAGISGVRGAVQNVLDNKTYVSVYMDGKELLKSVIENGSEVARNAVLNNLRVMAESRAGR